MRFLLPLVLAVFVALSFSRVALAQDLTIEVWKSPTCGCCGKWVDHLKDNGFNVAVKDVAPQVLTGIKRAAGVPQDLASCHTAKIGNYFVEGHVPADDIKRLTAEKPKGLGLAVPGMPIGSPGMEVGDKKEPYDVMLVKKGDAPEVYAKH